MNKKALTFNYNGLANAIEMNCGVSPTYNTYMIDIHLVNGISFPSLHVTEGKFTDTDVLIGMDIISQGDFAITAPEGKTKFSFQVPSTHDIDFINEIILKRL
jgi:hypothetical protein